MQRNLQDGLQHYKVLGLPTTASQEDIKQAYRQLARVLHPDKGGSSTAFAALQAAFETLNNPKTRAVYDALAADVRFKPGAAAPYSSSGFQEASPASPHDDPQPPPGVAEALLLQQLLRSCGGSIDPWSQLCVTCEVCRRPATKECWTCGMAICDFCTRRQHWKGSVPLHWPLVNSPGRMIEQLGKQEFEQKRKEDALAYKKSQPGYRPEFELLLLRQFQDAICDMLPNSQQQKQKPKQSISSSSPASKSFTRATSNIFGNSSSSNGHSSSSSTASAFALPANGTPLSLSSSSSSSENSTGSRDMVAINNNTALASPHSNSSTSKTLAVPNHSRSTINKCLKAWQSASPDAIRLLQGRYDYRLARFYMWTQTETAILLAVHLPTGGTSTPPKLTIEATSSSLTLQHQGYAPVVSRLWSHAVDTAEGFSTWTSADGKLVCLVVPKGLPGKTWNTCFLGDSHGARCLQSPYSLLQLPHEVQLELPLPFWVVPEEDLIVTVTDDRITVMVDGLMRIEREYWKNQAEKARRGINYKVVDTATTNWCIFDQQQQQPPPPPQTQTAAAAAAVRTAAATTTASGASTGRPRHQKAGKVLSLVLGLPELTLEEIQYKKGVRQNNAAASRSCPFGYDLKGRTFFIDDEDEFGLSLVLQALLFHQSGCTWLTAKPWEVATGAAARSVASQSATLRRGGGDDSKFERSKGGSMMVCGSTGIWVDDEKELPTEVQRHLKWFRAAKESEGDEQYVASLTYSTESDV